MADLITADPFDLERFVRAQAADIDKVRAELAAGAKRTHWMWFVFPQHRALGRSPMAKHYGIISIAEARAYMTHPILGPRLVECASALLAHAGRPVRAILGTPDDLKLRSCMTLFGAAAPEEPVFAAVLNAFYSGTLDAETLAQIRAEG